MSENTINVAVPISDQELEWIRMLCEGNKLSEIAALTNINKNTLAYKIGNVKDRLGCKNTVHMVSTLYELGLLPQKNNVLS